MSSHSVYRRLWAYYFCYFVFIGIFMPYWSLYLQSLGFDAAAIAVLVSLQTVMRVFAPNVWGWLADRSGRRRWIIRLSANASLLAFAGVFFGTSFGWLVAVTVAMSFFWSASLPLVEATTFSVLKERTGDYGVIRAGGSIGFVLAVVGAGYFLDWSGITALLWLLLAAKIGIAVSARGVPDVASPAHTAESDPVWRVLLRPPVLALLAACLLMAAAHGPFYAFFSIYLVDHGYSKGEVGWLWALGVIFEIGVFLFLPRLMERFSIRQILVFSFACGVVRFALIGWGVGVPWLIALAQVLHAATFGSYHAAAAAAIHRYFRGRHQARGQAFYTSLSFGVGGTLGTLASGYGWTAVGPALTFTLGSVAALVGLALIVWRVRPDES